MKNKSNNSQSNAEGENRVVISRYHLRTEVLLYFVEFIGIVLMTVISIFQITEVSKVGDHLLSYIPSVQCLSCIPFIIAHMFVGYCCGKSIIKSWPSITSIFYILYPLFFTFIPVSQAYYKPSERNMNSTFHICCINGNYTSKCDFLNINDIENDCIDFKHFKIICTQQITIFVLISLVGYSLFLCTTIIINYEYFRLIYLHYRRNTFFNIISLQKLYNNSLLITFGCWFIYLLGIIYTFIMKYVYNFNILNNVQIYLPVVNSLIQLILIVTVSCFIKNIFKISPKSKIYIKFVTMFFTGIIIVLPILFEITRISYGLSNNEVKSSYQYCCNKNKSINDNDDDNCKFIKDWKVCEYEKDFEFYCSERYMIVYYISFITTVLFSIFLFVAFMSKKYYLSLAGVIEYRDSEKDMRDRESQYILGQEEEVDVRI